MDRNTPICQSCGMPIMKPEDFGGSDYCQYCFKDGGFTLPDLTLEQMIERLIPFAFKMGVSEEDARKMAMEKLPRLKRWRRNS